MHLVRVVWGTALTLTLAQAVSASVIVNYTVSAGGTNSNPLNGLAAAAAFTATGTNLSIVVQNTSAGVPAGFDDAASLVVTLGFNLPSGIDIASGNAAVIAPGSVGIGTWSGRIAGDTVAEQWVWTNDFGGDLMNQGQSLATRQIITTSEGQDGGVVYPFDGLYNVDGPFGGIAAGPPTIAIPFDKPAAMNALLFDLTLTQALTAEQLQSVANGGVIEFGSDVRYLVVPEPTTAAMLAAGLALLARRRRSTCAD